MTRASGILALAAFIGALWAGLYWMDDFGYATAVVAAHVAAGLGLFVLMGGRGRRASGQSTAGAVIGALWTAPLLLFLIDHRFFDIKVGASGVAVALAVVALAAGLGALLGGATGGRALPASAALFAYALVGPLISYLLLPSAAVPTVSIVDRSDGALEAPAARNEGRLVVLGVDGASWNVIVPLLSQGKLPHLRSLMERGGYGILESVPSRMGDTASPVVWTSMFTGLRPDEHGIRDWFVADSRNRTRKTLWNILNAQGERVVVVNVPGTFPPEVVDGAMISGFPIPGVVKPTSSRFHAAEGRLYTTSSRALRVVPTTRVKLSESGEMELPILETLEGKYGRLRHRAYDLKLGNLVLELLERRGLLQTRELSRFWLRFEGEGDARVARVFPARGSNQPIAELTKGGWSDWLTVTFKGVELELKLHWIASPEDEVSLYATPLFQSSSDPVLPFTYPLGLAARLSNEVGQYVVEGAGWLMHEDDVLLDSLYQHVDQIGREHLAASEHLAETVPDWKLFVHVFTESDRVQHPFWRFQADGKSPHRDKVRSMMERIDAGIGELVERFDDGRTTFVVVSDHGFLDAPERDRGEHSLDGIFIFAGRGVAAPRSAELNLDIASFDRASVLDVTPTALFLLGLPVAEDMAGRPLVELGDEEQMRCCPLGRVSSYETEGGASHDVQVIDPSTLEQLRSLGYVP